MPVSKQSPTMGPLVIAVFVTAHSSGALALDLDTLLRPGSYEAEIHVLKAPKRLEDIAQKMARAAKRNGAWLTDYVSQHKGGPLPWHKNLGVTRDEYEFLVASKSKLRFSKVHSTRLQFKRKGKSIAINTGGRWKFFDTLQVELSGDRKSITTAVGKLANRSQISATSGQTVTGPWNGVCWRSQKRTASLATATAKGHAQLCIGRLEGKKRGLLVYEARKPGTKDPHHNTDFAVYFSL